MSSWGWFEDWIAALAFASLAWVSGLVADIGPGVTTSTTADVAAQNQVTSIMRWAQTDDEPRIEQVGEESAGDIETLDEEARPSDEDVELLDQGPAPTDTQDVETLDQGPVAVYEGEPQAPHAAETLPVTSYVDPPASAGPLLPEGFGTGDVHVAAGSAGFPAGLEDCHVGAVTGRPYVGVDCGEAGEDMVVGHAPSFDEFPFVIEEDFPYGPGGVFTDRRDELLEDNVVTVVSSPDDVTPYGQLLGVEIRTAERPSSVEFEQKARHREPRVEADNSGTKRGKEKRRTENAGATTSESQDITVTTSTDSKQKKKKSNRKDRIRRGTSAESDQQSTTSTEAKKDGGKKKGKKKRAPN